MKLRSVVRVLAWMLLLGAGWCLVPVPACAETFQDLMNETALAIQRAQWERVAELGDRLVALRPDNKWAHYYRGLGLTNMGRYREGDVALERSLQLDPELFWAHYIRFFNASSRGDTPRARACAAATESRITAELARKRADEMLAFFASAAPFLATDDTPESLRAVYERARQVLPDSPLLQALVAQTWFRVDMATWRRLATEALAIVPEAKRKAHHSYRLPLQCDDLFVHQGNNDGVSHLGLLNGYGWDFCAVDTQGRYASEYHASKAHHIYGRTVLAARAGLVVSIRDDSPDTEPGHNHPDAEPNSVVLRHEGGEHTVYFHLARHSVCVRPGERVECGQPLGKVGCSGRYVDFPHLHFGVYRDRMSVEAWLTGYQVLSAGTWTTPRPAIPKARQRIRSVRPRGAEGHAGESAEP